jgi:hypothetical protein
MTATMRFPRAGRSASTTVSKVQSSEHSAPKLGNVNPHTSHAWARPGKALRSVRMACCLCKLQNSGNQSAICPYADRMRGGGGPCTA